MSKEEKKQIIITQDENGLVSMKVNKGVKWSTFIVGAEIIIECLLKESGKNIDLDFILDDIRRIYERDKNEKDICN